LIPLTIGIRVVIRLGVIEWEYGNSCPYIQKGEDRRQRAFMLPPFKNAGLKKDVLIQETIVVCFPKLFCFRRGQ
jgi:hypothetical protein